MEIIVKIEQSDIERMGLNLTSLISGLQGQSNSPEVVVIPNSPPTAAKTRQTKAEKTGPQTPPAENTSAPVSNPFPTTAPAQTPTAQNNTPFGAQTSTVPNNTTFATAQTSAVNSGFPAAATSAPANQALLGGQAPVQAPPVTFDELRQLWAPICTSGYQAFFEAELAKRNVTQINQLPETAWPEMKQAAIEAVKKIAEQVGGLQNLAPDIKKAFGIIA